MVSFRKPRKIELTQSVRETYFVILTKLIQILSNADLNAQAQVVKDLVDLLIRQKDDEFVRLLNGIGMWGGSGAVWEVYIEDTDDAREFEVEMIKLINLMEQTNLLGKGIKPIRKIFKDNIERKK